MKKVRVMARKQPPAKQNKILKGATLFAPLSAGDEFQSTLVRHFELMRRETETEIIRLFEYSDSPALDGATLDAGISNMAAALLKRLQAKFTKSFNQLSESATRRMIERVSSSAEKGVKRSMEQIGEAVSMSVNALSPAVKDVIKAGSFESANLIKRVPSEYLDDIGGDVMRSITSGRGLQDLQPALESHGVKVRNWAKNVALDQTRKAYNSTSFALMKSAGVTKFEWVHSGGSNDPREYHQAPWPTGLNGGIFSLDDPPVIDKRTGEKGMPGQLPYCRCTFRPVIDFGGDEE